jgi:ATP phosphoribosyltransferase
MKTPKRLRIAIQKSGRLNNDSMDLFSRCGLKIHTRKNSLFYHGENLPIDILLVRDDDIPNFVIDAVCDLGIVGENVLLEQALSSSQNKSNKNFEVIKKLGFSRCRLSIALPEGKLFDGTNSLRGIRIATTYPNLLQAYLSRNEVKAKIVTISGSVEIAPRLDMADAICDLVATGRTLEEHNLKEVAEVIESQAVLIKSLKISNSPNQSEKNAILALLLNRIDGVLKARESKYVMFHAPKASLPMIKQLLPGHEMPTIMSLDGVKDRVAVHVVSSEGIFWVTLEKLKQAGASSILVLPIEKMLS